MSKDIQVTNSPSDSVNFKDNAAAMHTLPEHTQLMLDDVYGKPKTSDYYKPYEGPILGEKPSRHLPIDGPIIVGDPFKDLPKDIFIAKPTASEQDRTSAAESLEKGISRLIPEGDRASIKALTDAITSGDSQAFADAVKATGGDPRKLKDLCSEVDKMLAAKGSTARMDVASDGTVVLSDGSLPTAIAVNPKTGFVSARGVEHNMDGSTTLKPGELLNVDLDDAFRQIGDSAVNAVNGKKALKDISVTFPIIIDGDKNGDSPEPKFPISGPFGHNPLKPGVDLGSNPNIQFELLQR